MNVRICIVLLCTLSTSGIPMKVILPITSDGKQCFSRIPTVHLMEHLPLAFSLVDRYKYSHSAGFFSIRNSETHSWPISFSVSVTVDLHSDCRRNFKFPAFVAVAATLLCTAHANTSNNWCPFPARLKSNFDYEWKSKGHEWSNNSTKTDYLALVLSW